MKYTNIGAITAISLCVLMASLGTSIVNIALPSLTIVFKASFQTVQWLVIAYLLTITACVVIVGKIANQYGHQKTLRFGICLFTISALISAFLSSIWILIIMRAIQGIGAAILTVVSMAIVKGMMGKEKTGTAMGLMGTMSALGTAIGPSAGALLLTQYGWPSIFILLALLGIVTFFLVMLFINKKDPLYEPAGRIHFVDSMLLLLTIGTYALAMTISKEGFNIDTLLLISASVILGMLFFSMQKLRKYALIDFDIIKNKVLLDSLLKNMIVSCLMMTTLIIGPFFLTSGLGFSSTKVGLIMSVGPVISIFTGIISGKIVDRIGAGLIMKTSLILLLSGTLSLALLPIVFGGIGYISGIVLLTPGYQLFQAANNTAVMSATAERRSGTVSGILNLSRNIGLITGTSLMGSIFIKSADFLPKAVNQSEKMFFGFKVTFFFAALLIMIIILKDFFIPIISKTSRKDVKN